MLTYQAHLKGAGQPQITSEHARPLHQFYEKVRNRWPIKCSSSGRGRRSRAKEAGTDEGQRLKIRSRHLRGSSLALQNLDYGVFNDQYPLLLLTGMPSRLYYRCHRRASAFLTSLQPNFWGSISQGMGHAWSCWPSRHPWLWPSTSECSWSAIPWYSRSRG